MLCVRKVRNSGTNEGNFARIPNKITTICFDDHNSQYSNTS
jgi:hypothetical protein